MVRFVAYAVAAIVATLIVARLSSEWITFTTPEALLVLGAVIGVINAVIKPILKLITFPLSCLTFGLFAIVLNALLFGLGARLTPGITVTWEGALLASLVASLASGIIFAVVDER